MPFTTRLAGRGPLFICLVAFLLGFGLSGCGRRGPLEPPPDASAPKPATRKVVAQPGSPSIVTQPQAVTEDTPEEELDPQTVQNVVPTPNPNPGSRKRGRAYTIPKEPFILDPLL